MFTIQEIIRETGGTLKGGVLNARVRGVSIDTRTIARGEAFVAIKGDTFDGNDFIVPAARKGASCIIASCARPAAVPAAVAFVRVSDGIQALAALGRARRRLFDIPVIALTGSNGKTTTKDMCAWVLGGSLPVLKTEGTRNNHIGVPMTLLGLKESHRACVLELGTNHFGEIRERALTCEPTVGIITTIGPSHLEHFKTLCGVLREKSSLLSCLKPPAIAVLNADDPFLARTIIAKKRKPFIISIGVQGPADYRARGVTVRGGRTVFRLDGRTYELDTPGVHNVYNALCAVACARMLGLGHGEIASRLREFSFPRGRLSLTRVGQTSFIDDSYNSSPASLSQALETLGRLKARGRKILVMGDMLELGKRQGAFHRRAGEEAARSCTTIITVGRLARLAFKSFLKERPRAAGCFACERAEEAKELLFKRLSLTKDDVVLVKGSRRMKLDKIFEG
ncbi:MAG: UDP-N-acetylmuramoyl-tripeptide--D-alanyl-D-alanine ligase [Deltaproteobacteria bacterium]